MDFFEHWFGISLDGGSGAAEFALLLVPVVTLLAFAYKRFRSFRAASTLLANQQAERELG